LSDDDGDEDYDEDDEFCWEITEIPLIIIIKALAPSPIA
jgi:hypothetical protein